MSKERSSNIELLRIIAMLGVIVLHINNPTIGGALNFAASPSVNKYLLYVGESLFIVGVNVFIAISGFFLVENQKRNVLRVVELLLQVVLVNIAIYLIRLGLGNETWTLRSLIGKLLPVNYYAVLYSVIYIISPWLNLLVKRMSLKELARFLSVLLISFSVIPTAVDVLTEITGNNLYGLSTVGAYGSQYGYTCINFGLMYLIGAYVRLSDIQRRISSKIIFFYFILCTIIITVWAMINDVIGFGIERSAWEYCNPIVILESTLFLMLFSKLKMEKSGIINSFSKSTFTVYLLHTYFLGLINFKTIVSSNPFIMCISITGISIAIYICCYLIDIVYKCTIGKLIILLEKRIKLSYSVEL